MNYIGGSSVQQAHSLALIHARKQRIVTRIRHRQNVQPHRPIALRGIILRIAIAFATLAAFTLAVHAQSTFGSIRGTVQDGGGAVIPGASILAHSLDDNSDHQATSNDAGEYSLENLKPGHYKLTVHRDGFSDAIVNAVALEVRQELRLPVTLSIAQQSTSARYSSS